MIMLINNFSILIFQVRILINNAGIVLEKNLLETPDIMIQKTFDVNVVAHFRVSKSGRFNDKSFQFWLSFSFNSKWP